MKEENLLKAADYIEKIDSKWFNMSVFRGMVHDRESHKCNSVGCVVGHCTILDTAENIDVFRDENNHISFYSWSNKFFDVHGIEWQWLFSDAWELIDNTTIGAAKRIRHFVENGLPQDYEQQMSGQKPLCYI